MFKKLFKYLPFLNPFNLFWIVDPCYLSQQEASAACINCLDPDTKRKAIVMFKAMALKALGGTDLTNVNTMRQAAACRCLPDPTLLSFAVLSAQRLATDAQATNIPSTAADIRNAVRCYCGISDHELKAAESILDCYLSAQVGGGLIL